MKYLVKTFLLSLIALGFSLSLGAQPTGKSEKRHAAHKEMKAYVEANVLPVMSPLRTQLDHSLSVSEQDRLLEIRTELKSLHMEVKTVRNSHAKPARGERPDPEMRSKMQAFHKQRRQLMTQAWEIADAHEDEIAALLSQTESQQLKWEEDMRAIMTKYKSEVAESRQHAEAKTHRKGHKGGPHGHGHMGRHHGPLHMFEQPVRFLLWDPTSPLPGMEERPVQAFPNPTMGENQLSYEVVQQGFVKIDLLNTQGQVIRTILSEEQNAGTYTQSVNLTGLEAGVYTYRIKTATGIQIQKIEVR